jgi:hypothetical protein
MHLVKLCRLGVTASPHDSLYEAGRFTEAGVTDALHSTTDKTVKRVLEISARPTIS